jgi:hypothetical protein
MDLAAYAAAQARADRARADEWERIADEAKAERRDWQAQTGSPLGPRRHCAAVDRRIAAGAPGAARVGRRALLSPEALREELEAVSKKPKQSKPETTSQRIERRLGLVGGIGR